MAILPQLSDAANIFHTALLRVHDKYIEAFRERVDRHAQVARTEPGCLAFDVYQSTALASDFLLFEIYRDERSLEVHRDSPHFQPFAKQLMAGSLSVSGGTGRQYRWDIRTVPTHDKSH